MCLYLTFLSTSNEVTGIKLLFNPLTDAVSSFCLQGQLGLGEDRIHISTPCLLSYSPRAAVTQIQAGDSYSAAVTGELNILPAVVTYQAGSILCLDVFFKPKRRGLIAQL